jgi:trk system potassium uptake protein TrkH
MWIAYLYSEDLKPFIYSLIITLSLGVSLFLFSKDLDKNTDINRRNAYLIVTISWILVSLFGTLPYFFSKTIPMFVDELFESVSGFTTTGASILTDIESLPKSILFWRSLTHWIGGIGIIMLVIIILPSLKMGGYHLFTSESSFQEKIKPKIKQVSSRLLFIYVTLTIIETILLLFGNMNLFESVCHSFATISTGGFSPKNSSITLYSPYIQYVIMIFMLLAGTNYIIYYYLIKRDFFKILKNEEFKFYLKIVFLLGFIITLILIFKMHKPIELAFREAFFQVISIITCTGFSTADYLTWPKYAWIIIFFLMFIGGSTGSTSGGIKIKRHLIFFKNLKILFSKILHPHAYIALKINNKIISDELNKSILTFIFIYLITFLIGSFIMIILGFDGQTSCSSVATCLAGIGPGISTVGPASNFAHISVFGKIFLTFLMILGRLEIYPVIILFTKDFWKA